MSAQTAELLWDEFLQRWPLESLDSLTLPQYSAAGSTDTLTYWLEVRTQDLGSIWGGSSFKFGIFSRKDKTPRESGGGSSYSDDYGWYSKYGTSPEEAFARVKEILREVAHAASVGDLAAIDRADLGTVTKWKLAFLYQDRNAPCIVPLFLEESLRLVSKMAKPARLADIHAALMADRNGVPLLEYGRELWADVEKLKLVWSTERMKALLDNAEDIHPVKAATQKMAGYQLPDGRQLAVNREAKTPTLFLEPGEWQQVAKVVGEIDVYPPDRSRHSGLEANAPRLSTGSPAVSVALPNENAFRALLDAYLDPDEALVVSIVDAIEKRFQSMDTPLNQILYGPPGTGKTYHTINAALEILDPLLLQQLGQDRKALKARFDELVSDGRIRFVTFHQSFSYEDFVEGLRAETSETTGQIRYDVVAGVFKSLCSDAQNGGKVTSAFEQAVARLQEKLEVSGGRLKLKTVRGKEFEVAYDGGKTFRVFPLSTENDDPYYVASMDNVRKLFAGESKSGMYNPSYVDGMLRYLQAECGLPAMIEAEKPHRHAQPYVLIIDEINRGNISRIFGELITLIEPSKRAGAAEELKVTLPYSKDCFTVPGNVYLIGTMNTADRSLAGLDLALRRRFTFREMPPRPELLAGITIEGAEGLDLAKTLEVMNQRIAVLLDRDHCLGHAYFLPLQAEPTLARLATIFRQSILPLLQEYFFEDWERIRWVLNDQSKKPAEAFIVEDSALKLPGLFPKVYDKLRQSPQWTLNDAAFANSAAYLGIIASVSSGTPDEAPED